jgi:hypothetical protein
LLQHISIGCGGRCGQRGEGGQGPIVNNMCEIASENVAAWRITRCYEPQFCAERARRAARRYGTARTRRNIALTCASQHNHHLSNKRSSRAARSSLASTSFCTYTTCKSRPSCASCRARSGSSCQRWAKDSEPGAAGGHVRCRGSTLAIYATTATAPVATVAPSMRKRSDGDWEDDDGTFGDEPLAPLFEWPPCDCA